MAKDSIETSITTDQDNYLVVSTLQLGFCMTLYVEGRPKPVRALIEALDLSRFFGNLV